ncbi:hypothetical protein [uncultured Winogradskyella sp.]|uniref:hypothetical protein n=1 Tax=uncultured Winogradskyella sp. TaxID=395353 RepID=UPI0030DB81FF
MKDLVSTYDTQWFLGDLTALTQSIASRRAQDQLGMLSSPLRQLYFLGGLLVSSDDSKGEDVQYTPEKWNGIVRLLNEIEKEYEHLFFPKEEEKVDEEWLKIRKVAMPSFLSYFNQGPLNYEEQIINWITDLYLPFDTVIEEKIGVTTSTLITFYNTLDTYIQNNFRAIGPKGIAMRPDWEKYTNLKSAPSPDIPAFFLADFEAQRPMMTYMMDKGMIDRFFPEDIVNENLSLEQINTILGLLSCSRAQSDFLYYTATKPGNPLYKTPIIRLSDGLHQVFEVKQVIHAIEALLQDICSSTSKSKDKLIANKGQLLETRVVDLFTKFFKDEIEIYTSYYVDGCEQDVLILWKEYAFIIEAKGYNLREPLRDPSKAFPRIKDDFNDCIGYGYTQAKRVQDKFASQALLRIEDKKGNLIKEINTSQYEDNDFAIIVNLNSFGQVQNDLSTLLDVGEDVYPWAVKLDDLEVFILTLIAKKKKPHYLIDYLSSREELHGKLVCSDELEICGGYLKGMLTPKMVEKAPVIKTHPNMVEVFDLLYHKGMGFKNEKLLAEKESGSYRFW